MLPCWREEFLQPMSVTPYRLPKRLACPDAHHLDSGRPTAITADTGLRLDRYFGLSEGYWLGLQQDYDLRQAKRLFGRELARIKPRAAA